MEIIVKRHKFHRFGREWIPILASQHVAQDSFQVLLAGIFQNELILYPIPSDALEGEPLGAGAYVEIIGELNEPVW